MITPRTHAALAKATTMERTYEERIIRVAAQLDKWRRRRMRIEARIAKQEAEVNAVINRLNGGVSYEK